VSNSSPLLTYLADFNRCRAGNSVLAALKEERLSIAGITVESVQGSAVAATNVPNRTAQYVAVNDMKKDLVLAMADMSIFDREDLVPNVSQHVSAALKWLVVDANWHRDTLRRIISQGKSTNAKVAFEPVSVAKSAALFQAKESTTTPSIEAFPNHSIDLATPNQHELAAMHASAKEAEYFESDQWWQAIDALGIPSTGARDRFVTLTNRKMTDEGIPLQTIQLLPFIPTILTKLGADGVLLTELLKPDDPRLTDPKSAPYILSRTANGSTNIGGVYMRLFPAVEVVDDVVSVNGVGDTFLGVLVAGLARGLKLDERLIDIAQRGAVMTLRSKEAVSPKLGVLKDSLAALALAA
jgi:pseudouridine-5'-phosphate glycosidase/pseudouridine kinase